MKTQGTILLVALFVLIAGSALASTCTVCSSGCPYTSIQAAVNASSSGDTIVVCPGTYNEHVFVEPSKDYLTIESTEIPDRGPNTMVSSFTLGWAPIFGPTGVTIKGFKIEGCKPSNGVGIESSGNYSTIAFNYLTGCYGDPASAAIRVNTGNHHNNVHHNYVENSTNGIKTEINGSYHVVHQNIVMSTSGEACIWVESNNSNIHDNQVGPGCEADGIGDGIDVRGDYNNIFQNEVCGTILLFWGSNANFVHHNLATGGISDHNPSWMTPLNREKKNEEGGICPLL